MNLVQTPIKKILLILLFFQLFSNLGDVFYRGFIYYLNNEILRGNKMDFNGENTDQILMENNNINMNDCRNLGDTLIRLSSHQETVELGNSPRFEESTVAEWEDFIPIKINLESDLLFPEVNQLAEETDHFDLEAADSFSIMNPDYLSTITSKLKDFANSSEFSKDIDLIANGSWHLDETRTLLRDIDNVETLPDIRVLPFRNLQARGAFGDDTIYLSQEFLEQNLDNPRPIANVIFEEMGHYLDSRLSREDSRGDEGAIFASLVQNQHLGTAELHSLKQEDDHATLNVEGQVISVELADWDPSSTPFPETREAWEWPFSAESIWNLPLGNNAVYEPANLKTGKATKADVELLYQVSQNDPLTRLYAPGSWTNRCSGTNSPTGNPADEIYIRFPEDEIVGDANPPHTPNNTTSILQPDGETIRSVSPLARCEAGGPVYGWYYGEENIYGMGVSGGHGGSKLSGLGGSIRLGELTNNEPIRHALKINVFANKYLHYDQSDPTPGYRWPASRADGYAADRYGGTNEDFEMGSLLAIPQNVTPESLGIESLPALKLFYALQNYGAYVVDDTAWDVTAFNLQKGVKEEFEQTYGHQFVTNDANSQWFQEYYTLVESLHLVTNNSSSTIGGGGSRVAPLAPPFASDTNHSAESNNSTNSIRVEAETMNLSNYNAQPNSSASGGKLISLYGDAGLETGTASFDFQGVSGNYDVVIGYYDENDGEAQIKVQQNDPVLDSWELNQQLGSNVADSQTFTTKTVATNLSVNQGDTFTLTGNETEYEHVRIDYLEFIPNGTSDNTSPIATDDVVSNIVAAVNVGGTALTQDGIDFATDTFFLNGNTYEDDSSGNGLQSVFDGTIYESERYGATLNYKIPVDSAGKYTVELYFAEIYWSNPGKRIFDVVVEGETVFDDLDILAETGGDINQPFIFEVPSTVSPDTFGASDAIDIFFDSSTDNGKVSGIVIRSADNTPSQTTSPVRVEAETMNLNNPSFVTTGKVKSE